MLVAYPALAGVEVMIPTEPDIYLSGTYTRPRNPRGTIVFLHGFAAERTENGLFPPLAAALHERRYATLSYDWRGLGKSDGDFGSSHLQHHVWDFQKVLAWLRTEQQADSSSTCALGFSLGATAIVTAAREQYLFRSAILLSPAIRPAIDMWPRYATRRILERLAVDGYVRKSESDVILRRPILESLRDTDLGDASFNLGIPLLVCHGTADARIPIGTTRRCMAKAREDLVTALYFEGASHSFRPASHRLHLSEAIYKWLTRTQENSRDQHAALAATAPGR